MAVSWCTDVHVITHCWELSAFADGKKKETEKDTVEEIEFEMFLRRIVSAPVSIITRGQYLCYSTDSRDTSVFESIEPVSMSFNSYETTSTETTAPPIIIMHGNAYASPVNKNDLKSLFQLVAGLFGSKTNWRSISKALHAKSSPTRKVFTVDARNHGESPHSPSHRYEDLAEDVAEFYRQHNISKAVVLGHSMGGRAMMTFALKYVRILISFPRDSSKHVLMTRFVLLFCSRNRSRRQSLLMYHRSHRVQRYKIWATYLLRCVAWKSILDWALPKVVQWPISK